MHYSSMENIPTYALYGEQDSAQDWLHWETIPARSRQHGFKIAPHRHEHLFQVLSLTAGAADVVIDGTEFHLEPPCTVVLPALVVHGYTFSENVDGIVLTLFERDVRTLELSFDQAVIIRTGTEAVSDAMARLIDEADHPKERHALAMRAHMSLLLLALHRAKSQSVAQDGPADRMRMHASAFRQLVEERFRKTRRISDYADALGISAAHLNRVCREVLGASALSIIERRVVLEARRQLVFSQRSIKQIGADLGYDDPAYFTRFFTRMLGMSPGQFRQGISERSG